jgi:integrase
LFSGLRPSEAANLRWEDISFGNKTIRVNSRKIRERRVVNMDPACFTWLSRFKDQPLYPPNWRKRFKVLQAAIGFGTPTDRRPDLKGWPEDLLRHTAASYMISRTGSYAETADSLGNSETVLRKHYRAQVEKADLKRFYSIRPTAKGGK